MPTQYRVNEMFCSVQGEGGRAGTLNVFVRLAGCNLKCSGDTQGDVFQPLCDTEFTSSNRMTGEEIATAILSLWPSSKVLPNVILTGGEPGLQVDTQLIGHLKRIGAYVAIETNGTCELPSGIDYVTVSPKTAEHTIKVQHPTELRYVRRMGHGIPRPKAVADFQYISPAFEADGSLLRDTLEWCIKLVKENPDWRLSVQQHKFWGVR